MADLASTIGRYPVEVAVPSPSPSFFDASVSSMDLSDDVSMERRRVTQSRRRGKQRNNNGNSKSTSGAKSTSPVRCVEDMRRRSLSLPEDPHPHSCCGHKNGMHKAKSCRWHSVQLERSQSLLEASKARWHGVETGEAKTLSVPRRKSSHPDLMGMMDEVEREVNEMTCEFGSVKDPATPQDEEDRDNPSKSCGRYSQPLPEIVKRSLSRVNSLGLEVLVPSSKECMSAPPPPRRTSSSPRLPRRAPELQTAVSTQGPRLPRRSLSSNRSLLEDYFDDVEQEEPPANDTTTKGIDISCKSFESDETVIPGVTPFDRQVSQESRDSTVPPALPWRKESVMDLDYDFDLTGNTFSRQPSRTA